ncbi:MAG: hypothetical protein ACTS2F_02115 [Thainema sp.]
MSIKFFQVAFVALAGASLATLAFAMTPLRAEPQWGGMPMGRPMHSAQSQGHHRGGGPGWGGGPCCDDAVFDSAELETLEGTALEVNQYNGHQGVFVRMQTGQGPVEVHLGPAWYLEDQGIEVTPGSALTVTGFRNQFNNQPMVMATELQSGDQVVQLRDADGFPVWMGRGFRHHPRSW